MKKHFILLSLKSPDLPEPASEEKWKSLKSILKHEAASDKKAGIIELAENAWLIPRDTGLPFVAECISRLKDCKGVTYKTWFLDESE